MFKKFLDDNIVLLDGAMGTALQDLGLKAGAQPELINLSSPETVFNVHKSFIDAGARVLYANTFGANIKKLPDEKTLKEVITAALKTARCAAGKNNFVALDIGPIGELLEPLGSLSFDGAYDVFKQVILLADGQADLIVIETMTSLYEMKAALLAARENSNLPVLATMSFEDNSRTFTGCTPAAFAMTASPLCDALGVNCSLGPDKLMPIVKELSDWTDKPLVVKANAGMPDENGVFSAEPKEFASFYREFLSYGVSVIGGCCGTTPAHIRELASIAADKRPLRLNKNIPAAVCSETVTVKLNNPTVVGERINPTGKKAMQQALLDGNFDFIKQQAAEQTAAGADILDVNTGMPGIDESAYMKRAVTEIMSVCSAPLQIDSKDTAALETGLRYFCGKAIVNSVTGESAVMDKIFPLVKKYGASVIGLTLDEDGIPETAEKRLEIAQKILKTAKKYGIYEKDVIIDCLTLTVSAEQKQAAETLKAIGLIKQRLNLKTVLGVSNISFGMPARNILNTAFLTMALQAGLDLAIINPNITEYTNAVSAYKVLSNRDEKGGEFIARHAAVKADTVKAAASKTDAPDLDGLMFAVLNGLGAAAADTTDALLTKNSPMDVVNNFLMPALEKAGSMFESGELFLPQLISAAEAAKCGFDRIRAALEANGEKSVSRGKIVLATVKGDIHDIGKNIVKILLQNHGYTVIDLGKNVDKSIIVKACKEQDIRLCGLSALMTTTAAHMRETVVELKKTVPDCRVMVGGAVITQEFADSIDADFYAKDANQAVKFAAKIFE